ncbi:MAG: PAS domain S-box protein [Allosphingosinicella sp.]
MSQANAIDDRGDQAFKFRPNEAFLHNVMENAAVGMALLNTQGRWLYVNRAYAERLGYEPDDCTRLGARGLIHPDDLPLARQQLDGLAHGEVEGYRADRRYLHRSGAVVWGLTSASMLRDERTGDPLYIIIQVTDIDGQKRAEAALAETESRWNFAQEAAGQGDWDHDVRNKKVFYSRMWRLMRGFGPDEEVDGALESWLKRVHPDDRERILSIVLRQDSGEIQYNAFEYRERHKDGRYIWILSRGRPIEWFPDGQPARIVGTDTDITSLKAVAAELAEEKERLRVTLQSIGDGVISTDANGRVIFLNPIAEQMTGWTSAEAVGRRVEEVFVVVNEETGEPVPDPVGEALGRQWLHYLDEDAVLVSRTGERRAVRDSAAPVRTLDGPVIGAVLVFQDITQSRALQKELAHSAMHDGLTGLPNRKAFERVLAAAAEQALHEGREHALCFVDLDHFKQVNDSAGHAAGDALLQQIGQAIHRACRSQDFAGRIGGDEFALLLGDCSLAGAAKVAQQVVDAIADLRFTWHGQAYEIGASVGITAITASSPSTAALMAEADAACYAAKNSGRNRVSVYDDTMSGPRHFAQTA